MRHIVLCITPREREALQLLANGVPDADMARNLDVAESDVDVHLARLFAAIGAASQNEAIAIARKRGLLEAR
jgi:DNA-binding CsgD family transcriptional regulator